MGWSIAVQKFSIMEWPPGCQRAVTIGISPGNQTTFVESPGRNRTPSTIRVGIVFSNPYSGWNMYVDHFREKCSGSEINRPSGLAPGCRLDWIHAMIWPDPRKK